MAADNTHRNKPILGNNFEQINYIANELARNFEGIKQDVITLYAKIFEYTAFGLDGVRSILEISSQGCVLKDQYTNSLIRIEKLETLREENNNKIHMMKEELDNCKDKLNLLNKNILAKDCDCDHTMLLKDLELVKEDFISQQKVMHDLDILLHKEMMQLKYDIKQQIDKINNHCKDTEKITKNIPDLKNDISVASSELVKAMRDININASEIEVTKNNIAELQKKHMRNESI